VDTVSAATGGRREPFNSANGHGDSAR
jgi:hypothetical protein